MKPSDYLIRAIKNEIPLLKEDKIPAGFAETVDMIFEDGNLLLDKERLNILASYWNLPPVTDEFFNHYFSETISSIDQFKRGLDSFTKDALWHFGDLKRAYLTLCLVNDIEEYFSEHKFHTDEMRKRLPWKLVEEIKPEDRGFLGYVSGQRPKQQKDLLSLAEEIISEIEGNPTEYEKLDREKVTQKVFAKLSARVPNLRQKVDEFNKFSGLKAYDLFSSAAFEQNKEIIIRLKDEIEKTISKVDELKVIGKRNQEHYLRNIESIDIYVATSMRNDEEYLDMYNFISKTFADENIKILNLRYFDPTLCYCDSRIDKGIIECLLVRSSKVTIYCAQEGDTFGKDSELAATMAQGKPVIVYVPIAREADPDIAKEQDPEKREALLIAKTQRLDSRARTFKDFHPLGLQVGLYDGVARGVIVVRTPEECSSVLFNILTNALEVKICYEQHGLVLRERDTDSVLRVMTGWGVLANCFWNQFIKTQNPKAGLPD